MWTMKDHRRRIRLGAKVLNKKATPHEIRELARLDGKHKAYCEGLK